MSLSKRKSPELQGNKILSGKFIVQNSFKI